MASICGTSDSITGENFLTTWTWGAPGLCGVTYWRNNADSCLGYGSLPSTTIFCTVFNTQWK